MSFFGFGKKKAFKKGMEEGAKPFEEKFNDLGDQVSQNTEEANKKMEQLNQAVSQSNENLKQATDNAQEINVNVQAMNADVQATGQTVNAILDNLSQKERYDLYQINNNYDVSTLDEDERQHLIGLLYTFSAEFDVNELQQKYVRHLQAYLGVTEPQIGVKLSSINNIDSLSKQRIYLQVMMEYDYLNDADHFQDEALENFSVNDNDRHKIATSIKNIVGVVGVDGLIEKYGMEDIDEVKKAKLALEQARAQIEAERAAFEAEKKAEAEKQKEAAKKEQEKKLEEQAELAKKIEVRDGLIKKLEDFSANISRYDYGLSVIQPSKYVREKLMSNYEPFESGDYGDDGVPIDDDPEGYHGNLPKYAFYFDSTVKASDIIFYAEISAVKKNSMVILDDGTVYFLEMFDSVWNENMENSAFEHNLSLTNKSKLLDVKAYTEKGQLLEGDSLMKELPSRQFTVQQLRFNLKSITSMDVIDNTTINSDSNHDYQLLNLVLEDGTRFGITGSYSKNVYYGFLNRNSYTVCHFDMYKDLFENMKTVLK